MKKKLQVVGIVIVVIILLVTFVGPHLILMADRQEAVAEDYAYSEYFFDEYDDVRSHLLDKVD